MKKNEKSTLNHLKTELTNIISSIKHTVTIIAASISSIRHSNYIIGPRSLGVF